MLKTSILMLFAGFIAAGAVVNGAATQRWSGFEPDAARTEALQAFEVRFQDWRAEPIPTDMPTNERSTATSRRYFSSRHAAVVTFISGIPGSVSAHTPDVCYPSSGYKTLRGPKKVNLELPGGMPCEMYVADFEKKTNTKHDRARVRWTWLANGAWVAPDRPRWQFAMQLTRAPVLYKVYIVTALPDEGEGPPEDDAVIHEFVAATLTQYAAAAK